MDVTPIPTPVKSVKPVRTKAGVKPKSAAAAPKKAVVSKKAKPAPEVKVVPSGEELRLRVAEAAYFIAAERGFAPGNETEDWLRAEKLILGL